LAAREIASLAERQQIERVVESGKLYHPEWRETMRLLGGVLRLQGEAKIEGLFQAILGTLGSRPTLANQVRCVALLSAMMRDLSRMGYQPKTPDYERTVKEVMGIFEAGEAEKIEIGRRIEAADLLGQVGDPRLEESNWVTIPAGTFHMGAQKRSRGGRNYDAEAFTEESPVHAVALRRFRIGRFPVTVQEFGAFMADSGYSSPQYWVEGYGKFQAPDGWEGQKRYPNRPVVGVSWFEAAAYCSWAGGRLPTEAQWERAARGPQGNMYPWGNRPPLDASRANFAVTIGHPTPVGLFPKGNTAEGLCDMLGNVFEWTADWYDPKYYEQQKRENLTVSKDPQGPPGSPQNRKVMRGGAWYFNARGVRVSSRDVHVPSNRLLSFGFRCAGE
jgi:formylglycine-generating enzyme required for sulfatase activity